MRQILVKCHACHGLGQLKLNGKYADTLRLLVKHPGITGADLARIEAEGCKATAMNNRLAYLERQGLATSTRYGKLRLFTAKGK